VLGHEPFVKANQKGEGGGVEGAFGKTREDGVLHVAVVHSANLPSLPAGHFEDSQWQELLVDCCKKRVRCLGNPRKNPGPVQSIELNGIGCNPQGRFPKRGDFFA